MKQHGWILEGQETSVMPCKGVRSIYMYIGAVIGAGMLALLQLRHLLQIGSSAEGPSSLSRQLREVISDTVNTADFAGIDAIRYMITLSRC
jgi:hypothetical protein